MTKRRNLTHSELFSLPPIATRPAAEPAAVEIPPRTVVTGNREVDLVIWLRALISSANPVLLAIARQEAKRIKTPMEDLEKVYAAHLHVRSGGGFNAVLSSIGFGDLNALERRVARDAARRSEALARFGTPGAVLAEAPAEAFSRAALRGLKRRKDEFYLVPSEVDARFLSWPAQLPRTLTACISELTYWRDLSRLRHSFDGVGDSLPAAFERERFVRRQLAVIPPESVAEALAVFDFMQADGLMDQSDTPDVLRNLIAGPRREPDQAMTAAEASNT